MNKFFYSLKQAFVQIFRNKGMSLASIFAITAMLLILGLFFVVIMNISTAAESIKQDYNNVELFLLDETPESSVSLLNDEIKTWEGVSKTTYRTKEEALNILKKRWGKNAYLLEGLAENPLPNSIVIEMNDLSKAPDIAKKCEKLSGIEDVKFYKDTVDKLLRATRMFQIAALVVMAFLIMVSVVVVSNTIKLTVIARSEEIFIMKHIGATNWFIRAPFLLEGILIGAASALLSWGLVIFAYGKILKRLSDDIIAVASMEMVPIEVLSQHLLYIFLSLGVAIGAWGSIISMRRFLDT